MMICSLHQLGPFLLVQSQSLVTTHGMTLFVDHASNYCDVVTYMMPICTDLHALVHA